jgi:hypothetical protein
MNHPSNEEWGMFLFGEAPPELNRRLKTHLSECQQCADEVRAMQDTIAQLDAWKLDAPPRQMPCHEPVLKFAMAALIILGVGIGVGRLTSPAPLDGEAVKASVLADVSATLDRATAEYNGLLAAAESRMAAQTQVALQALGSELLESVSDGRAQDQRAVQAVIDQLKQQRDADYVSLRRDLETVAAAADQQLQQARLKLFELAVNSAPKE